MKKRILGLALALIMVISLLPLTAFAETTPMPKVNIIDPNYPNATNHYMFSSGITGSNTLFIQFENVLDDTDPNVVKGNKPIKVDAEPTDNYIKVFFNKPTNTLEITLTNVTYNRTAADETFFSCGGNSPSSKYNNKYNVLMTLEGTNTITGSGAGFNFGNNGSLTITGSGSLTMTTLHSGGSKGANINKTGAGELIIKDTTLNLENTYAEASTAVIVSNGNVTIDGSNVTLIPGKNRGIVASKKYNEAIIEADITIKSGSVLTSVATGSALQISTKGKIVINNSTVELSKNTSTKGCVISTLPYLEGNFSSAQMYQNTGKNPEYKDITEFEYTEGTALNATEHMITGYKVVHECAKPEDDGDCTTALTCGCGKTEYVPAKMHTASTVVVDCTLGAVCGNEGCTKPCGDVVRTEHEAADDDGLCTTAVQCKHCQQIAIPAAEAHTGGTATCTAKAKCEKCGTEYGELKAHEPKEGTFACDVAHPCKNCDGNYREAGTHVGEGTEATCQKKAVCKCGSEYGELAAHKPEADDNNCETAIKCSVCGAETTAALTHKYTDNNDASCDNEGCQHTRTIENANGSGDTTNKDETPKDEPAKDETPKDEPAKDETPKDEPAKDETPKDEPAKDETPKDETNKGDDTNKGDTTNKDDAANKGDNPSTGDTTPLVLMIVLMMASAAAFVCTKKFAR